MVISEDTQLGSYRIVRFLASGGMGDVYEARHTELDRPVAIKVISADIARDPVAIKRFRREARAASGLNHPHVCAVYDFQEAEGRYFLVLEYLEGQTLAERMSERPLAVPEVLKYSRQIAEALDHAHALGLVHRDLKPGNVVLTASGAKVLDFGAVTWSDLNAPPDDSERDATEALTREGQTIGTLPYMSPEQVEGAELDGRTDIYSLGVMMYEMLTGRLPFERAQPAALAVAILQTRPVPVERANPDTPPSLVRVVERCMARDPDDRWQTARNLAAELRWIAERGEEAQAPGRSGGLAGRVFAGLGIALSVAGLFFLVSLLAGLPGRDGGNVVTLDLLPPDGVSYTDGLVVLSPDGRRVAFSGTDGEGRIALWVRDLDSPTADPIPETPSALQPFWSPDGSGLGFFSDRQLKIIPRPGASPLSLAPVSFEPRGATWSREGVILYSPDARGGVFRVEPGSEPVAVSRPDAEAGEDGHLWPHFLPDGERYLYYVASTDPDVRGVYWGELDGTDGGRIVESSASAVYVDGWLLFVRNRTLLAQRFDERGMRLEGEAAALVADLAPNFSTGGVFSASGTGVLSYVEARAAAAQLVWVDSVGRRVGELGPPRAQRNPDISGDGRFVAVEISGAEQGDIWYTDLRRGSSARIDDGGRPAGGPVWTADGSTIAFATYGGEGGEIYTVRLNRAAAPELLLESATDKIPTGFSPDGTWLVFMERTRRGDYDLWRVPTAGGEAELLFGSEHTEILGRFAPSGDRIAYVSNETGRYEVFVETFPPSGPKCQISANGGYQPAWGGDDETVHYLDPGGRLMRVTVGSLPECATTPPVALFSTAVVQPAGARNHYSYSPLDGRFLFVYPATGTGAGVRIVINWPDRLEGA